MITPFARTRWRLLLWNTLAVALLLASFAVATYYYLQQALMHASDLGSQQTVRAVGQAYLQAAGESVAARQQALAGAADPLSGPIATEVRDPAGRVIFTQGPHLLLPPSSPPGGTTLVLDGVPVRLYTAELPGPGGVVTVRLVKSMTDILFCLGRFRVFMGLLIPCGLLLALLLGRWLTHLAMGPIAEAFERLRRFTADASHELRTPLATIQLRAEILEASAALAPEDRANVQPILDGARRLTAVVADLLFLARHDENRLEMQRQVIDLHELAEDVVSTLQPRAAQLGVQLVLEGATAYVEGDAIRLHQTLTNVVDNAVLHGGPGTVGVTVSADGNVLVRDRGAGIAAEHLPHVFERFYRANPGRPAAVPGTGLGLAIVKSVVDAHRGTVSIESVAGEGTSVRISLPVMRIDQRTSERVVERALDVQG